MRLLCLLHLATILPTISAHGRITNVTTSNGTVYTGWDPELAQKANPSPIVAWRASNLGNIFVKPSQFNTSDITCHYNATPGALHVATVPGDTLKLQWNEWPSSHKGPVLTYVAACGESCATVDKESLRWSKIDHMGWLNSSGISELGGTWASDVLRENGAARYVKVPQKLKEGHYVLRHEIIALHVADQLDGAQAYPQCINLEVGRADGEGMGEDLNQGVRGEGLYGWRDSGVLVDIHNGVTGYNIPGPSLWEFAEKATQPGEKR